MEHRFYVGIDIGRREHAGAVLTLDEAARWERVQVHRFTADGPGFDEFFSHLDSVDAVPGSTVCALESTGGYYSQPMFHALRARGYEVLWAKNQAVHDLRQTVYGRRPKTDQEDARLIARLLYLHDAVGQEYAFFVTREIDLRYRNLRVLVELRWKQIQARRRATSQLTQVLDVLFPELRLVFLKRTTSATPVATFDKAKRALVQIWRSMCRGKYAGAWRQRS